MSQEPADYLFFTQRNRYSRLLRGICLHPANKLPRNRVRERESSQGTEGSGCRPVIGGMERADRDDWNEGRTGETLAAAAQTLTHEATSASEFSEGDGECYAGPYVRVEGWPLSLLPAGRE